MPVGRLTESKPNELLFEASRLLSPKGSSLNAYRELTLRKEVIQPQVLLRLPCYDFTPITTHTLDGYLPKVKSPASSTNSFRDVTVGVYKARERIHRGMLIRDY